MTEPVHPQFYAGHVMHMRLIPKRHKFRYRVFTLLIDIDRLDESPTASVLFGHNRLAMLSLFDRDHGPRDGGALRPWVNTQLAAEGLATPSRVLLMSFPRMWGYAFNPLSVYYCYDGNGELSALIYEVKNTFGDQIAYVHAAEKSNDGAYRHARDKSMYVSPFIGMEQRYRFDVALPDERLSLRIRQSGPDGETLISTLNGQARPFTNASILGLVLSHPLMTLKVVTAIHWEALRLWLKGVRLANDSATAEARS